jgi:hypothetical protein
MQVWNDMEMAEHTQDHHNQKQHHGALAPSHQGKASRYHVEEVRSDLGYKQDLSMSHCTFAIHQSIILSHQFHFSPPYSFATTIVTTIMPTPDTSGENRAELIRRSNWRERLIPNGEQPGPVVKTGFGTLLARRGHFDRDTRIVRWLKDVARFPPPTDIPAANLVFNPLSHPRQAQLDPNLDAITRRLFPMCDEGSIPRQSGTLSAGSDAHTIPVGGTARGSRSGGGGQPNGIDNQSALYYWLHIAPTKPEAQLLAAHLGLNFPDPADTMYRVTLGLKYVRAMLVDPVLSLHSL